MPIIEIGDRCVGAGYPTYIVAEISANHRQQFDEAVRLVEAAKEAGTYHRTRDVEGVDEIELDKTYVASDLINILRARTFPPYKGAYFIINGRRIYMRLHLEYGEEG